MAFRRSAGGITVAAAGTGRLYFGPMEIGRVVEGLHLFSFSDGAADTHIELEIRAFTDAPVDTAASFADGENQLQTANLMVPLDVSVFLPLDSLVDRAAWVGIQVTNPGAGNVMASAGVETRVGTVPVGGDI